MMDLEILYSNPYVQVVEKSDGFYIESFHTGYTLEDFNKILQDFPQIKITNFMVLRTIILNAPKALTKFGEKRARVEVEVSNDHLKSFATLFVPENDLTGAKRKELIREILDALEQKNVVYGIMQDVLMTGLYPKTKILIAQGLSPINGEPSRVRMYEIEEPKPQLSEDGSVNHYELNLINKVDKGDWLGERINATPGVPGKTVLGEPIPAQPGKQVALKYDKKSVGEMYDEEKGTTTLYALKTGAVFYHNDIIHVYDYLEIEGDVSFKTGNIDFEGFVHVQGSIEDNFSVIAKNDIEVKGDLGIGGVEKIESTDGCIYIRGGISGKGRAHLTCKQDLYTKFAADCIIECEGTVHIGFYCINCSIKAKEVILEARNSRIIGGMIEAEIKVVASEVGNRAEIPTSVLVTGFDRKVYKDTFDKINASIEEYNEKLVLMKQKIAVYSNSEGLLPEQLQTLRRLSEQFQRLREELKALHADRKKYISYLRTKGEGEIQITKQLYPNVNIDIKGFRKKIMNQSSAPITYYVSDGELKTN